MSSPFCGGADFGDNRVYMSRDAPSDPKEPAPKLTAEQGRDYEEGWALFASGHYWHAHEAWERLWRPADAPARAFVQGLIQLTAACHLLHETARTLGALKNFAKAEDKLRPFAPRFLRVDVQSLLRDIDEVRNEARRLGDGAGNRPGNEIDLTRFVKRFTTRKE